MADETCVICNRSKNEHNAAEREGVVHHKYSLDGQVHHVDPPKKSKPAPLDLHPGRVRVPPDEPSRGINMPSDPILRFVMIQKGLITTEELDEAEKMLKTLGMLQTGPVSRQIDPETLQKMTEEERDDSRP